MLTVPAISQQDQVTVNRVSGDLRNLRVGLMNSFPEREWLINQILIALVSRNDVLVYGTPGTGKSMLIRTVLRSIIGRGLDGQDVRRFSTKVDNETTLDKILGPSNIPHYEKTGDLIRTTNGYLPWANFAYIDEVFDGPAVLRGLNDVLNERELNEPPQIIACPLYTAIGATNRSPLEIEAMLPQLNLGAFNDRWLFVSRVEALKDPANQDLMLMNHLTHVKVEATVQFADLQQVVSLVRNTNQFPDLSYVQAYRELVNEYKVKSKETVSDRRLAWMTQIIEAQAILQGRMELYYEDMYSVVMGLCDTTESKQHDTFMKVATPIIETSKKARNENVDHAESLHLNRIEADLKKLAAETQKAQWPTTSTEVGEALTAISNMKKELDGLKPKLDINERKRLKLAAEALALQTTVVTKI